MNTTPEQLRLAADMPNEAILRECLAYEEESGMLIWKERPEHHFLSAKRMRIWNSSHAGKLAGVKSHKGDGRPHCILVRLTVGSVKYSLRAHRVILVMTGKEIPDGMVVDHRDGNPFNNRIGNLRLATIQQNVWNQPLGRGGKYPCGVHRRGNSYRATISVGKKNVRLGTFKTPEEAGNAYAVKASEMRGEFIRKTA